MDISKRLSVEQDPDGDFEVSLAYLGGEQRGETYYTYITPEQADRLIEVLGGTPPARRDKL